ncbi:HAD superfamily hydrolase (TIGR01509 family) [Streptomyces sp. SLBN-118]|uniref:HAD family hydrolase n=1 Tax=Streptomyces sp. SLBN-118 TaxID=2768454 RepID=UPI00114D80CD|nr:HAD family phosphatase [Streptomyces sp. SLBN-118]TQK51262.1 HAD superfamily hydrolase (TIGR01509 family) [Streptomyces sp. SLBN-118]
MRRAIIPAVIFDLDGTLVDSEPNYYESARRLFADHGVEGYSWARHCEFIGIGTRETLQILREQYSVEATVDELLSVQNGYYLELASHSTAVFPQMRRLVGLLHAAGHPMAVASGSSPAAIDAVRGGTGLSELIPLTVSAEEVVHGKPAPDIFLEAARRLGVDPADCVVIEDAAPGAEAANRAGIRCIAVPTAAVPSGTFPTAGLVIRGGQAAFSAETAYDWITSNSTTG